MFERDIEVDRPFRQALRHFPGAYHALKQRVRAADGARPLGHRLDQTLDAADAQSAVPLRLDLQLGVFAQSLRFARHDQHRYFILQCAVNAHAALQDADGCMQQNGLWPSSDQRVAGGHVHGERFVPALDEGRPCKPAKLLAGERLPDRRPLRSGR